MRLGSGEVEVEQQVGEHAISTDPVAEFRRSGWGIARGLIAPALCDEARERFRAEVRPHPGPLLRQHTRPEPHRRSVEGYMTNALLSVQDLDAATFAGFRAAALEIIAGAATRALATSLLGVAPKLVESMFFETTPTGTVPHADCCNMDSEVRGQMVGLWFALEDIAPAAGPFFVVPHSHALVDGEGEAARLYREYIDRSTAMLRDAPKAGLFANTRLAVELDGLLRRALAIAGLRAVAPAMRKGDVLAWHARLVHGSLPPTGAATRSSLTAHYIPEAQALLQYGERCPAERWEPYQGMSLRSAHFSR